MLVSEISVYGKFTTVQLRQYSCLSITKVGTGVRVNVTLYSTVCVSGLYSTYNDVGMGTDICECPTSPKIAHTGYCICILSLLGCGRPVAHQHSDH